MTNLQLWHTTPWNACMHDDREASLIGSRDEREWIEAVVGPHLGRDWTRSAPAGGQRDGTREAASLSQPFLWCVHH